MATILPAQGVLAQEDGEEAPAGEEKKPEKRPAAKKNAANDDLQDPEDVTLTTGDGLKLGLTYYPGTKGKESIPVILLHSWKGSRKDFTENLAPSLQKELGCAVIVPDLRGHGESTVINAAQTGKKDEKLNAATMSAKFFPMMVTQDLLAVKNFLWKKNNAEELNINKTCVVGVEMGASLALGYAVFDAAGYEHGQPIYGPLRLGRFVKAMVLISPELSFKGLNATEAVKSPDVRGKIALMILTGAENPKALAEAKRLHGLFERYHPAPDVKDPAEKKKQQTLWFGRLRTKLPGPKILEESSLGVTQIVGDFITLRVIDASEAKAWSWKPVKLPHE